VYKRQDQEKYDAALASAESLLKSSDYEAALMGYKSALAIKPAETYPKNKISEIEKLINERTSRKEAYDIAIKNGDQAFGEKKYDPALSHYRNALSLLPGEKYPTQRIEEINTLLAQQKTQDENYKKTLAEADKLFVANKFEDAIIAYNKCMAIKPEEVYPQQKITEAQNQLANARSKDENYSAAIAAADKSLAELKYDEALSSYKQALTIKPAEKYPKDKSDEINKILAKQKSDNDKYILAISNGEKAMTASNHALALNSFQEASGIKPNEQYPKDKIAEINAALAAQQKNDELYNTAVKNGDLSFGAGEYDKAIASYTEATNLKKAEKYPQDQLAKINKILADAHSAQENYTQAITEGDNNFTNQKFAEAIASYKKAQAIKPSEEYPKTQIEKINTLLVAQEKQNADYLAAIASADKQFTSKSYDEAILGYRKALELKPTEKYPSEKIAEAEKLIADLKALQESYDKAIANGEKSFTEKDYPNSLVSFKSASDLKPTEAYPKQKINEIQAILDQDKAEAQRYQEAVAQGDKLLTDKKYNEALAPYQQASTIRPSEKYPLDQIAKINQLITEQNKLEADYLKLTTDAGILLKDTKYNEARSLYVNAGSLKPDEKLPKDKIAEIDAILAGIQQQEANYTKAISEGDAFFTGKKYTEAITSYTTAADIKPSETYPKTQLEKINTLLTEQKKLNDEYLTLIATADKSFDDANFQEAIIDYRKALTLKSAEKYPADRIAESEKQIADLKAKQEAYEKAITEGDKKFLAKDYENALTDFRTAVSLKAAETYPAQKITEIQTILDKNKAENDRYQDAITLADKFFASEKYREALEPYQRATTIKPTEKYPQEQINHINQLLAEQKKLDDDYQKLIIEADVQMLSLIHI
jgi:tetratricopeptide (TPR) repeat protein